jgi:hypothetical protein
MPAADALEAVSSEEEEIVNFINNVAKRTAMHFNVNVGIFVPKPHTPYQWARQIDGETAACKLDFIRSRLKKQGHKVSVSDPLVSMLEGILSRGDERAGLLVEQAFRAGSRLDAWQEFIAKDAWQDILENNAELSGESLAAKDAAAPLPWNSVASGVSAAYLRREFEKSLRGELTPICAEDCKTRCGVCNDSAGSGVGDNHKNQILPICSKHICSNHEQYTTHPASYTSDPGGPSLYPESVTINWPTPCSINSKNALTNSGADFGRPP